MSIGYNKILTIILGLILSVMSTGCCIFIPAKPVQPAYITTEPPYTVRLMFPYKENEKIRKLKIHEYKTVEKFPFSKRTTCWHIKAIKLVSAKGFKVTIGHVSDDFEQVIPERSVAFVPNLGSEYLVEIITTNRNVHYLTWWYPGNDNMVYFNLIP